MPRSAFSQRWGSKERGILVPHGAAKKNHVLERVLKKVCYKWVTEGTGAEGRRGRRIACSPASMGGRGTRKGPNARIETVKSGTPRKRGKRRGDAVTSAGSYRRERWPGEGNGVKNFWSP